MSKFGKRLNSGYGGGKLKKFVVVSLVSVGVLAAAGAIATPVTYKCYSEPKYEREAFAVADSAKPADTESFVSIKNNTASLDTDIVQGYLKDVASQEIETSWPNIFGAHDNLEKTYETTKWTTAGSILGEGVAKALVNGTEVTTSTSEDVEGSIAELDGVSYEYGAQYNSYSEKKTYSSPDENGDQDYEVIGTTQTITPFSITADFDIGAVADEAGLTEAQKEMLLSAYESSFDENNDVKAVVQEVSKVVESGTENVNGDSTEDNSEKTDDSSGSGSSGDEDGKETEGGDGETVETLADTIAKIEASMVASISGAVNVDLDVDNKIVSVIQTQGDSTVLTTYEYTADVAAGTNAAAVTGSLVASSKKTYTSAADLLEDEQCSYKTKDYETLLSNKGIENGNVFCYYVGDAKEAELCYVDKDNEIVGTETYGIEYDEGYGKGTYEFAGTTLSNVKNAMVATLVSAAKDSQVTVGHTTCTGLASEAINANTNTGSGIDLTSTGVKTPAKSKDMSL